MRNDKGKLTLVRFKDMAKEVGYEDRYNDDYFEMSAFVHSAPASVFEHSTRPAETLQERGIFAVDPSLFRAATWSDKALSLSNAYVLTLLVEADIALCLGLLNQIPEIQMMWLRPPTIP